MTNNYAFENTKTQNQTTPWWRYLGLLLLVGVFLIIGSVSKELYNQYRQNSLIQQEFGIGGGPGLLPNEVTGVRITPTPSIVGEPTILVFP